MLDFSELSTLKKDPNPEVQAKVKDQQKQLDNLIKAGLVVEMVSPEGSVKPTGHIEKENTFDPEEHRKVAQPLAHRYEGQFSTLSPTFGSSKNPQISKQIAAYVLGDPKGTLQLDPNPTSTFYTQGRTDPLGLTLKKSPQGPGGLVPLRIRTLSQSGLKDFTHSLMLELGRSGKLRATAEQRAQIYRVLAVLSLVEKITTGTHPYTTTFDRAADDASRRLLESKYREAASVPDSATTLRAFHKAILDDRDAKQLEYWREGHKKRARALSKAQVEWSKALQDHTALNSKTLDEKSYRKRHKKDFASRFLPSILGRSNIGPPSVEEVVRERLDQARENLVHYKLEASGKGRMPHHLLTEQLLKAFREYMVKSGTMTQEQAGKVKTFRDGLRALSTHKDSIRDAMSKLNNLEQGISQTTPGDRSSVTRPINAAVMGFVKQAGSILNKDDLKKLILKALKRNLGFKVPLTPEEITNLRQSSVSKFAAPGSSENRGFLAELIYAIESNPTLKPALEDAMRELRSGFQAKPDPKVQALANAATARSIQAPAQGDPARKPFLEEAAARESGRLREAILTVQGAHNYRTNPKIIKKLGPYAEPQGEVMDPSMEPYGTRFHGGENREKFDPGRRAPQETNWRGLEKAITSFIFNKDYHHRGTHMQLGGELPPSTVDSRIENVGRRLAKRGVTFTVSKGQGRVFIDGASKNIKTADAVDAIRDRLLANVERRSTRAKGRIEHVTPDVTGSLLEHRDTGWQTTGQGVSAITDHQERTDRNDWLTRKMVAGMHGDMNWWNNLPTAERAHWLRAFAGTRMDPPDTSSKTLGIFGDEAQAQSGLHANASELRVFTHARAMLEGLPHSDSDIPGHPNSTKDWDLRESVEKAFQARRREHQRKLDDRVERRAAERMAEKVTADNEKPMTRKQPHRSGLKGGLAMLALLLGGGGMALGEAA